MAEAPVQLPTRRERQRNETRERLFLAACAEIDRAGLMEAQIPRIAAEAGVARGTFYFHFPGKEDVLAELVARLHTGLIDQLSRPEDLGRPLNEVIDDLLDLLVELRGVIGETNLMREVLAFLVRRASAEPDEEPPPAHFTGVPDALAPHFAAAAARGEIRSTLEPERLAGLFLASMFGLMMGRRRSEFDVREELDLLADLFLRGLQP